MRGRGGSARAEPADDVSGRDLPLAVLEGLRRAHCSHEGAKDPKHGCAGELTVTPTGIKLACTLCGTDDSTHVDPQSWGATIARGVLEAAGLSWEALCAERQVAAIQAATRLRCPGCGRVHQPEAHRGVADIHCPCEVWAWERWRACWTTKRRPT